MQLSFRSIAITSVLGLAAVSAQANLTLPIHFTQSNSVQKFPDEVLQSFELLYVEVAAKGNATALGDLAAGTSNKASFSFPITKIVIGPKLNIASGSAVGSALELRRANDDGVYIGFTLANFTIDYVSKKVVADVTPFGGTGTKMAIYDYRLATPLALKYKFPLTVTGHEVLDQLKLTEAAKAVFKSALDLPEFTYFALDLDYGMLTQDISFKARKPAASTKPYVGK